MEEANELIQRQREEIERLNQELVVARGQAAALAPGPAAAPAPGPDAVPLPAEVEIEDYRIREAILRSVPKFQDNGTLLFRDHEVMVYKFLMCRHNIVRTDKFKKAILLESLAGKAVSRIWDNPLIQECYRSGTFDQFAALIRETFCSDSEAMLVHSCWITRTVCKSNQD